MIKLKHLLLERLISVSKINDSIKKKLAQAAQKIYDGWKQDAEGYNEELGRGGICHIIADDMAGVLSNIGIECSPVCSNYEQHVYLVAKFREGVFMIDIPYYVYERGGGFTWKKLPDVVFDESHVDISKLDSDPRRFDQYTDQYE